jgi:hypothetical protein
VTHPARACRRAAVCLTVAALAAVARPHAQAAPASAWADVLRDVSAKLASVLTRTEPFDLTVGSAGAPVGFDARAAETDIASRLAERSLKPGVRADGGAHVAVTCAESVQARLCTAEVTRGGTTSVIFAAGPLDAGIRDDARPPTVLTLRPLFGHPAALLDVVVIDAQRLLVLDAKSLTLFAQTASGWSARDSQGVEGASPWPRDVRGRLAVHQNAVEAFLPGRSCRGTVEPLVLRCSDAREAWPLGIENDGLAEGRNYFTSAKVPAFYSAAALQSNVGPAWLLSTVDGGLQLFDRQFHPVSGFPGRAGDVVALPSECTRGRDVVLVAEESADGVVDTLQAFDIVGGQRVAASAPASLPGVLVALWPADDGTNAVAITRNPALNRYEAFLAGLSCAR